MDWLKDAANSCGEGLSKAAKATQEFGKEKDLQMRIWAADRAIRGYKKEWGEAAYDLVIDEAGEIKLDDTLKAVSDKFASLIAEERKKKAEATAKLKEEFNKDPEPDTEASNTTQE